MVILLYLRLLGTVPDIIQKAATNEQQTISGLFLPNLQNRKYVNLFKQAKRIPTLSNMQTMRRNIFSHIKVFNNFNR